MKRLLSLILTLLCLMVSFLAVEVQATEVGGTCGDNVKWSLSSSGELTIYGDGKIANYTEEADVPWSQYKTKITSLVIEEGITTIEGCGFKNCTTLTSISIAWTVEEISYGAFSGCSSLVEIEIPFVGPKPLITEGETIYPFGYIFGGRSYEGSMAVNQRLYTPDTSINSYTTYYIPESLTTVTVTDYDLYPGAFYDCDNLTTIVLCEGINSIGKSAFFHCDQLSTVKLPQSLIKLGSGAFEDCASLVSISLPDQISALDTYVFTDCASLENVTLPAQLETIGSYAFWKCGSLKSINLPSSLRTIDSYAFMNCGLQSINLPEGIECIKSQAFILCDALTSVFIPSSLTDVGGGIFQYCPGLTSAGPTTGDYCIRYAWSDEIPAWALSGCDYLTTVALPNSITAIPSSLFSNCSKLERIEIPASVTSIGSGAFSNCTALKSIIVPSNVVTIDYCAFSRCLGLKYIVLPNSVASMGWGVLEDCSALDAIFYFGTEVDWNNIEIKNNSNTVLTDTERYYITSYADVCSIVGHDWNGIFCQICDTIRANPFADVPEDSFYYQPVMWAVQKGITNGATDTTFNPNGICLRAHVVTFLHRAAGNPEPSSSSNPFIDAKPSDFFYKPVLWAVENGITNGTSATTFGSYANCNRAAVVTFLWRSAGSPEPSSINNPFVDVKTTDFFYKPVLWAVENGITNGVDATHFGPATDCNRAQVVTFLYRARDLLNNSSSNPIVPDPPAEPEKPTDPGVNVPPSDPNGRTYILNLSTMKFHYPNCYSVEQISEENYYEYLGTRDALISYGYDPCGRCDP